MLYFLCKIRRPGLFCSNMQYCCILCFWQIIREWIEENCIFEMVWIENRVYCGLLTLPFPPPPFFFFFPAVAVVAVWNTILKRGLGLWSSLESCSIGLLWKSFLLWLISPPVNSTWRSLLYCRLGFNFSSTSRMLLVQFLSVWPPNNASLISARKYPSSRWQILLIQCDAVILISTAAVGPGTSRKAGAKTYITDSQDTHISKNLRQHY